MRTTASSLTPSSSANAFCGVSNASSTMSTAIVSAALMPGMDIAAPERTETSRGRREPPKCIPVAASNPAIPLESAARIAGSLSGNGRCLQVVGNTKAGGTGKPICSMRMRFQALPPTSRAPPPAIARPREMG